MLSVIDTPKSKSVTIAYQAFKSIVLCLVVILIINTISSSQDDLKEIDTQCASQQHQASNFQQLIFIFALILDAVTLIYFYFTTQFGKLEFYVFYLCHIVLIVIFTWFFFDRFKEEGSNFAEGGTSGGYCFFLHNSEKMLVFVNLTFLLASLFLMNVNLYTGLNFINTGSNIFWFYSYLIIKNTPLIIGIPFSMTFISYTHLFLSTTIMILMLITGILGRSKSIIRVWRIIMLISFFLMLVCYLLAVLQSTKLRDKWQIYFFFEAYRQFGPFQMISPLLYLMFVTVDWKDPREVALKNYEEIFLRYHEHDKFNFGEVD